MHSALNVGASLLPPLSTCIFTANSVPDLVHFFQDLGSATVDDRSSSSLLPPLSSSLSSPLSSTSPTTTARMTTGSSENTFPSPFANLRNSFTNSFNRPRRPDNAATFEAIPTPYRSSTMPMNMARTTNTTSTNSQSPEGTGAVTFTRRARTWNYNIRTKSRSPSPQSMHSSSSHSSTPLLLSRRPSAVDLALLEEQSLSHSVREVGLGLELMEPRPVPIVPVAVAFGYAPRHGHRHGGSSGTGSSVSSVVSRRSSIFDAPIAEETSDDDEEVEEVEIEEQKQPFVMGGILEVMEGRS